MGTNWDVFDFGDTIPAVSNDPINEQYGKTQTDKNKCLLIHLAAAALRADPKLPRSTSYTDISLPDVYRASASYRWEQQQQATACSEAIGDPSHNDPLVVAELRSHLHDVLSFNHDRDHRALLCFPVSCLVWADVCIIRVS